MEIDNTKVYIRVYKSDKIQMRSAAAVTQLRMRINIYILHFSTHKRTQFVMAYICTSAELFICNNYKYTYKSICE